MKTTHENDGLFSHENKNDARIKKRELDYVKKY